jgi:hypothetical protein
MHVRFFVCILTAALALLSVPATARASSVAVEGGIFTSRNGTGGGGALSLGLFSIPATPLSTELTVAAGNGGAAGTIDVRAGGATQIGAGIGVGSFGATGSTTVIYDALLAQSISPHLSLEGRLYMGPQRPSTLFAGLRLAL